MNPSTKRPIETEARPVTDAPLFLASSPASAPGADDPVVLAAIGADEVAVAEIVTVVVAVTVTVAESVAWAGAFVADDAGAAVVVVMAFMMLLSSSSVKLF